MRVNRRKRCPPRLLGLINLDVNLKRMHQLYNVNLIGHVGLEMMFEINGCNHAYSRKNRKPLGSDNNNFHSGRLL